MSDEKLEMVLETVVFETVKLKTETKTYFCELYPNNQVKFYEKEHESGDRVLLVPPLTLWSASSKYLQEAIDRPTPEFERVDADMIRLIIKKMTPILSQEELF